MIREDVTRDNVEINFLSGLEEAKSKFVHKENLEIIVIFYRVLEWSVFF